MPTPVWKPGKLYNPGAVVQPTQKIGSVSEAVANASFESVASWTLGTGFEYTSAHAFQGSQSIRLDSTTGAGGSRTTSDDLKPVVPGQSITARVRIRTGAGSSAELLGRGGRIELDWLDENEIFISRSQGSDLTGNGNSFRESIVEAEAPAGAGFVRVSLFAFRTVGNERVYFDSVSWNYTTPLTTASGLVFRAVQADAGFSGSNEPAWPNVNGQQVIDNEVTWEAVSASHVVWEATPILVSGYDEPDWPVHVDGEVLDNTIVWTAISRQVTDEKCPNSAIVAIGASKVFVGDDDIIGFSATVNPLDYSTADDAGYLPFGLQTFGANPVTALALYRSNLVAFNSQGFQMWQIDEDPANMALLDSVPVGCTYPRTVLPVSNDLIFLSAVGVRNISIAGASTNLQAGTFGEAIDPLVLAAIRAGEFDPFALYVPAYGQYWLFFGDEAFVLTITDVKKQSWSRYTFPEEITDWTLENDTLLVRTAGHHVWRFSPDAVFDDEEIEGGEEGGDNVVFDGVMWWPYLDFNTLGVEKMFVSFDLVATAPEGVAVSIGYDQSDRDARTANYDIEADTLPAMQVPFPCAGPSFDLKLTFTGGGGKWEWNAAVMYVKDMRIGA